MSSEIQHLNQTHAGTCVGHCRAQRFALDCAPHCDLIRAIPYYCTEQYEKDKAALTSYEEGWDRWDGPVWPWRQTNYPEVQAKLEDEYEGCCNTPPEQENILGTLSHEFESRTIADDTIATSFLSACETSRARPAPSVSAPKAPSLWHSTSNSSCPTCGHATPCNS
jgi:hypothetical protein